MGLGIQIKKPDQVTPVPEFNSMPSLNELNWFYYGVLILTFPVALVALFFFFQTRNV